MFELPEMATLAGQMNQTLTGRVIRKGSLGNSPHKFVWYNRVPKEFEALTKGKTVGKARSKGRWLFTNLEPGYVLVFGECGGKILFHASENSLPKKFHLLLSFVDGTFLSATTQMWGAMELYEKGEEQNREYIRGMRPTPTDPEFTFTYFSSLIDEVLQGEKRSAKGLLTQDQLIPGLGNSIAQDILFNAKLHPRHPVEEFSRNQTRALYRAIMKTVNQVAKRGGRNDEFNLFGLPGGYGRVMDKNAAGRPCPECGKKIQKIQYLGGACYFCPQCQQ